MNAFALLLSLLAATFVIASKNKHEFSLLVDDVLHRGDTVGVTVRVNGYVCGQYRLILRNTPLHINHGNFSLRLSFRGAHKPKNEISELTLLHAGSKVFQSAQFSVSYVTGIPHGLYGSR
jgi:hypothetical protein